MNTNKTTERENNQLVPFTFEDHTVRTVLIDDAPWFVAKDVCDVLEIQNSRDAVADLDDDERMTVATTDSHSGQRGGAQSISIINESGLYSLVFRSRKPEAKAFRKWVTSDVLPAIRRSGRYERSDSVPSNAALTECIGIIKAQAFTIDNLTRQAQERHRSSATRDLALFPECASEGDEWISTTELCVVYGKSRATCLAHARAMGWPMRVSRLSGGALTYEFQLAGLPESLQKTWRERGYNEKVVGTTDILSEREADHV